MAQAQTRPQAANQQHRRDTLLHIVLPAGLGLLAIAILLVALMVISRPDQVSTVADVLLTVLVLCPLALCTFPIAIGAVVLAALMNRAHDWTDTKLGVVARASASLNRRIDTTMDQLARTGITVGTKTAPLEKKLFSAFDRPSTGQSEAHHGPTQTRRIDHPGAKGTARRGLED